MDADKKRKARITPWFKMWSEARSDVKLEILNDHMFRVWFRLLLKAAETGGMIDGFKWKPLAYEVARGDLDLLMSTLEVMADMGMVAYSDDRIVFLNFSKRNPTSPSETPEARTQRVHEHRERESLRNGTPETDRNAFHSVSMEGRRNETDRNAFQDDSSDAKRTETRFASHAKSREVRVESREVRVESREKEITPPTPERETADAVGVLSADADPFSAVFGEATPHALGESLKGAKGVAPAAGIDVATWDEHPGFPGRADEVAAAGGEPEAQAAPGPVGWLAEVYAVYPVKAALVPAERVWAKLKPDRATVDRMLSNIKARIAVGEWPSEPESPDMRFVPRLDRYLLDKRWTDAPPVARRQPARDAPQGNQARTLDVLRQAMAAAQEEETA